MSENKIEETESVAESVDNDKVMANAMANAIPEDSSNPREDSGNSREDDTDTPAADDSAETFPRSYVEKLRKEAAGHRDRAKRADDLAQRLHTALVEATGRLADPSDLPYEESHLEDPEALATAIDALLADKPHLATRKPAGDIGQGMKSEGTATVSLGGLLRANAQ